MSERERQWRHCKLCHSLARRRELLMEKAMCAKSGFLFILSDLRSAAAAASPNRFLPSSIRGSILHETRNMAFPVFSSIVNLSLARVNTKISISYNNYAYYTVVPKRVCPGLRDLPHFFAKMAQRQTRDGRGEGRRREF